jgi:hypothetical protein
MGRKRPLGFIGRVPRVPSKVEYSGVNLSIFGAVNLKSGKLLKLQE